MRPPTPLLLLRILLPLLPNRLAMPLPLPLMRRPKPLPMRALPLPMRALPLLTRALPLPMPLPMPLLPPRKRLLRRSKRLL